MAIDEFTQAFLVARSPLVVGDGWIDAGGRARRFRRGDTRSLLRSYVKLVRSMRRAHPRTTVNLRVADIDALAAYAGESRETIIDWLADVIGVPRIERTALMGALAAGATVVGLTPFESS